MTENPNNEKKKNVHEGHRARLKRKLVNSPDSILPHEALEILLFYALPQKNTNPIAHELLAKFGSMSGVLEADFHDLKSVSGIKEHSATRIKLMQTMFKMYVEDKYETNKPKVTASNLRQYLSPLFIGEIDELFYALMLDSEYSLISTVKLSKGTNNSSAVYPREIVKKALEVNAANVILVHNHTNGILAPSSTDVKTTELVRQALSVINVMLIDHIIVADKHYASIYNRISNNRTPPVSGTLNL